MSIPSRIVSSAIIRPAQERDTRSSFDDTRLASNSSSSSSYKHDQNATPRSSIKSSTNSTSDPSSSLDTPSASISSSSTTTFNSSSKSVANVSEQDSTRLGVTTRLGENHDSKRRMDQEGTGDDGRSGNKRARTTSATEQPAEDAKRGRRMMGMILGTLTQFKKQTGADSGAAVREALQERVREKLKREQALHEEKRRLAKEEAPLQKASAIASRAPRRTLERESDVRYRSQTMSRHWQSHSQKESEYLFTETKPRLRYLPKIHNDITRQRLKDQQRQREESLPTVMDKQNDTAKKLATAELDAHQDMDVDLEAGDEDIQLVQHRSMDFKVEEVSTASGTGTGSVSEENSTLVEKVEEKNTAEKATEDMETEEKAKDETPDKEKNPLELKKDKDGPENREALINIKLL